MRELIHSLTHRHFRAWNDQVQGRLVLCGRRWSRKTHACWYEPLHGNPVQVPLAVLDQAAQATSHLEMMAVIRNYERSLA